METLWFACVTFLLAGYVVLDGFDLGIGALYLVLGRTEEERQSLLASIGPFWDGNEVWLLAVGSALLLAFPGPFASVLSGFYLCLMIALWLLILRGAALEFRNHLAGPVWNPFWDATFALSSGLLPLCFGVALGNLIRGVPLDSAGGFVLPFWTDLTPGGETGLLDWYTLPVGLFCLAAVGLQGASWAALKTSGLLRARALCWGRRLWWGTLVGLLLATTLTFLVQDRFGSRLLDHPWGFCFPGIALGSFLLVHRSFARGRDLGAFLASSAFLAAMISSLAFGLYPWILPSNEDPARGLRVQEAASGASALGTGLWWWAPGMVLVLCGFSLLFRKFRGRSGPEGLQAKGPAVEE